MTEQLANNAITTLNGGITSTATSLVVNSASLFPTSPQFRILVDSELMLVTAVSGTTFTVTRGAESTTQAAHSSGANVTLILTAGALQQLRADTITSGTFASRPTVGTAGRIYRPTDGNIMYIDNGSSWLPYGPIMPLTTPPSAASFTLYQTGGQGTLVDDSGGLYFSAVQRVTTEDVIIAGQSNPGGTGAAYTLTVGYIFTPGGKNGTAGLFSYGPAGLGLYNTSTTQIRAWEIYADSAGTMHLQARGHTGLTGTGSALFDQGAYAIMSGPMLWLRIQDDGATNRTSYISVDGRHFKAIYQETRTSGFTSQPDKIGLYINAFNADAQMTVLSYSLTSP